MMILSSRKDGTVITGNWKGQRKELEGSSVKATQIQIRGRRNYMGFSIAQ
jgi:hypothetical protein